MGRASVRTWVRVRHGLGFGIGDGLEFGVEHGLRLRVGHELGFG